MNDVAQILVATDGSDHADQAVRLADRWSRAGGQRLTLVHVLHTQPPVSLLFPGVMGEQVAAMEEMRARLDTHLRERMKALTGRGPDDYDLVIAAGTPHVEIVRLAETRRTALIVLGARGSTGLVRMFLGHTAEKVARHAHCPVFVARPGPHTGKVLVATDLSPGAGVAVRAAAAFVRTHDRQQLSAVHVVDTILPFPMDGGSGVDTSLSMRDAIRARGLTQLQNNLAELGIEAAPIVAESPIPDGIVDAAEKLGAELVVVGTHGRTGLGRMVMGNTAAKVLERVHCSVLVVRQPD